MDKSYINRDAALDALKGFCMLCVVFGHLPKVGSMGDTIFEWVQVLYTFHVPIFVLISGWLFGKKTGCVSDWYKVANHLVKPYIIGAIVLNSLYWIAMLVGIETGSTAHSPISILRGKAGGALWFLYELFVLQFSTLIAVRIKMRFIDKESYTLLPLVIGGLVSLLFFKYVAIEWHGYFILYFILGFYMRQLCESMPGNPLFLIIALSSYLLLDIERYHFGNVVFVLALAIGLLGLFRMDHGKITPFFACIGRHSLIILLFHPIFITFFKPVIAPVLILESTGITFKFMLLIIVVICCLVFEKMLEILKIKKVVL